MELILFDLDGVLVDAKEIHFNALNRALGKEFEISFKEHLSTYDGLKTNQKLEMLSRTKGLPLSLHKEIWRKKQKYTLEDLANVKESQTLIELFSWLKNNNFKVGVCSNSITNTVVEVITKAGILKYIDHYISNEDVLSSKPHPEMYWTAMTYFKVLPEKTVIIEDSPYGLLAAKRSGAHVIRVTNTKEVNLQNLKNQIENLSTETNITNSKWSDRKLNVVIPMAGAGSRFKNAGFTFPKPLIEVNGKPMIQVVVENLNVEANFIFIVQKEHRANYNLDTMLSLIAPGCKIIEVDGLTNGAACTALLAKKYINNDAPLLFANSDQFVEWNSTEFFYKMNETNADGGIPIFKSTHPKWSFAKVNEDGLVTEVQEKNPISDNATVGFYYFKKGKYFVENAEEMISNNDRINNEFYLCPVYNYLIKNGGEVRVTETKRMWGLGTPEDLNTYLKTKK